MFKRPSALLCLAIAVLASPISAEEPVRPWLEAGELRTIQTGSGETDPQVRGVWQSRGYGRLLVIDDERVSQFEIGAACYNPGRTGGSLSEMDSVGYRFFRMLPDGDSAIFQLLRGDTNVVFDRLDALPEQCRVEAEATPASTAAAFLDSFESHYAFFDRRGPGHQERAARVSQHLSPGMSDADLWDAFAAYMQGLSDSHTKLIGEVDGERRRVQDGQGETLPRMRASEGGETAWLVGLIDQTIARLDAGARHTGNDRIIWGVIDGQTGYIQVFQMGGFTDREDFGSDAWADAELAEFDRIMDEAFATFEKAGVQQVLLDLSNNRGGWDRIAKALPGRFTEEAYTGFTTAAQGSGLAPFPHLVEPATGPRFSGPVILLTSDVTVSGGELATLALRQNPRVTQVGQTTRGAFSTPLAKRLPNGWLLELSNETFAAPGGQGYEGVGLEPHVEFEVYPASAPVEGHLQAIERAIEVMNTDGGGAGR